MKTKNFLLSFVLIGLLGLQCTSAQTTYSWRNDQTPTSGQWNVSNYWWNGSGAALPGGAEILFLDGSVGTTMTNDLLSTNRFKIIFGNTNSPAARTINGSTSNTFYEFGSTWPRIQNDATGVTHTINFPINASTNSGFNLELVPMAGPLVFGTSATINNNGRTIQLYGNNTAIDATNRFVRLSGVVSGTGVLNVSQAGVAKLNATNTYTGQTQVDWGELWIESSGDINASSGIWVGNGTQLTKVTKLFLSNSTGGTTFARSININAGNALTRYLGGLNTSGTNTFSGTIANSSSDLNLEAASGGTIDFTGVISGSGAIKTAGAGIIKLSAANTFSEVLTVNSQTTLKLGATGDATNTPLGTTVKGTTINTGGALDLNGFSLVTAETLTLNGAGVSTSGALYNSSASAATYSGNVTLGSATTIVSNSGAITLSGTVATTTSAYPLTLVGTGVVSGSFTGTGQIIKQDAGVWQVNGSNSSFTGSIKVTSGEIRLNPGGNRAYSAFQFVLNGGTLSTTGISATYRAIAGSSTLQLLASSTLALGSNAHSLAFAASNAVSWTSGQTLNITGWNPGVTRLYFGSNNTGLTSTQLSQITFSGYSAGASLTSLGELVPASYSYPVTVSGATGITNGTGYPTLGAAITAIGTLQSGNNILVEINANTTESTSGISIGAGTWSSLKIYPTSSNVSITGNPTSTTPLLTLSGATNVTIDGRLNQTGTSSLTIINSNTTSSTISFTSNSQSNTVKYCTIKGGISTSSKGVIGFTSTTSATNGNGLNTIDRNIITNNGNRPLNAIFSSGGAADTGYPNIGNTISNNEFKDCISGSLDNCVVIYIAGGATDGAYTNSGWTISGNSIYETSTVVPTSIKNFNIITIGSSTPTYGGSGYVITDNYIGGSAPKCGGSALTKSSDTANGFSGLQLNLSTTGTPTSVQNNTIQNISWTNTGTTNISSSGIIINMGDVNIGTVTGNKIGSSTGNDSFIVANTNQSAVSTFYGINIASTGTVDCENNKIGGIKVSGSSNFEFNFIGIQKTAVAGTTVISNNIIGSTTTANSINNTSGLTQSNYAILNNGTGAITISGNTIANINSPTTTGKTYGIYQNGAGATATINGNFIHSFNLPTSSTGGTIAGIYTNTGTNSVSNNIIKLNGDYPVTMYGLVETSGCTSTNFYHNTVYLSGSPASLALRSTCIQSSGTTTIRNFKNNNLVNVRSNTGSATGSNYAIYMSTNSSGTVAVDGNNYWSSGNGSYLGYYGSNKASLPIVTSNDVNSMNVDPVVTNSAGTTVESFVPSSFLLTGVDLHTTVATDYNGVSRTATPTIGALDYLIWDGSAWNSTPNTNYNAKIDGTYSGAGFSCRNLVLNAGKQLSVTSGTLSVANNFTIRSDASNGTGTFIDNGNATITGTTTVQQYLPDARNWYVSSPVTGSTLPALGYTLYSYDETGTHSSDPVGPYWYTPTGTFTKGVGYIALPGSTGSTLQFSGTLNTGDVDVPLTYSGAVKTGFNLIGNPYPSHLTWTTAFVDDATAAPEGITAPATLIEPTIWIRHNTGTVNSGVGAAWSFQTFNGHSGEAVPSTTLLTGGIIPPMQAFWVRAKQAGTLRLNNKLTRSHQSSNPLKARAAINTDRQRIRIQVSNGVNTDEALIYFDAAAANTYDTYDSPKMSNNNASIPEIYTQVENQKLVMNGLNAITDNLEISLGFTTGQSNTFTIKAIQLSNIGTDIKVYLKDNTQTNPLTELVQDQDYSFTSDITTDNTSRFSLLFKAPGVTTSITNAENERISVFVNAQNQLVILGKEGCNYAIYNAVGQLIENGAITSNSQTSNFKHSTGVYVVKVNQQTTRIVVK